MGSAEKKKLKAKKKLAKKKAKYGVTETAAKQAHVPWYRNPDWVRAIVAVITLIITVLLIFLGLKG